MLRQRKRRRAESDRNSDGTILVLASAVGDGGGDLFNGTESLFQTNQKYYHRADGYHRAGGSRGHSAPNNKKTCEDKTSDTDGPCNNTPSFYTRDVSMNFTPSFTYRKKTSVGPCNTKKTWVEKDIDPCDPEEARWLLECKR